MKENYKDDSYLSTFSPLQVVVITNPNTVNNNPSAVRIDDAIPRFRSLVTKEQIMSSLKTHCEYEKPSAQKRRKQRENIQRTRKAASFGGGGKKNQKRNSNDDKISIEND